MGAFSDYAEKLIGLETKTLQQVKDKDVGAAIKSKIENMNALAAQEGVTIYNNTSNGLINRASVANAQLNQPTATPTDTSTPTQ